MPIPIQQRMQLTSVTVPTLFDTTLPPAGPIVQIAYSNVNKRLREMWLRYRGLWSVSDVCHAVRANLENEAARCPPFKHGEVLHGMWVRVPWRREVVFFYELRWVEYFVHEAEGVHPRIKPADDFMADKRFEVINHHRLHATFLGKAWRLRQRKTSTTFP